PPPQSPADGFNALTSSPPPPQSPADGFNALTSSPPPSTPQFDGSGTKRRTHLPSSPLRASTSQPHKLPMGDTSQPSATSQIQPDRWTGLKNFFSNLLK
ncbi:MAG: hypothetical protein K2X02_07310, partial [Alphaproteobacteria bacterium]|nr:hypothetical protein [Alphaproteobacteria bacterium]